MHTLATPSPFASAVPSWGGLASINERKPRVIVKVAALPSRKCTAWRLQAERIGIGIAGTGRNTVTFQADRERSVFLSLESKA